MITVWGRRSSINVQKVLWALTELEIPFTRETVGGSFGGNRDADFLRMNPNGLVPVIRDGDVTMFESNAIVRYLAARYGDGDLRPTEHRALAMAEQWMEWQQTTFASAVTTMFFNAVRLPEDKRDPAAFSAAAENAAAALKIADQHLARHDWFAGHGFSFGEIVMGCALWRYLGIDCVRPDTPHLMGWFEALQQREGYRDWVMVPRARTPDEWTSIEKELG
ncbi:MAG: glutathione S-transferase family protein [Alphaproteobacteria bacterium]|nr:glutathione S-transferase family protein [Alphaproteobacteria bacterium]